jgi:dihydropteroate synthase
MKFQILRTDVNYLKNYLKDKVKVDKIVVDFLAEKSNIIPILVEDVPTPVALILKQEMLSIGSDAAISGTAISKRKENESLILLGASHNYKKLRIKLEQQPFGLKKLGEEISDAVQNYERSYRIHTKIMGILNITPDSFYDGGVYNSKEKIKKDIRKFEKYSDIIDVGAESSRPGSDPVSIDDERNRLSDFFENFKIRIPISLDTYKFETFQKYSNRVSYLNDISAFSDERFYDYLPETDHKIIIMHMLGEPKTMQDDPHYDDVIDEISSFFDGKIEKMVKSGIDLDRIIIDPGIGFGKRYSDNIRILREIDGFKRFGTKILVGHSNKRYLRNILNNDYEDLREFGTMGISAYLILRHIDIIRVHNVRETWAVREACNAVACHSD